MSAAGGSARPVRASISAVSSPDEARRLAPALDPLGRTALADRSFSLVTEFERPYARVWVASEAPDDDACGLLVAWDVADEWHVLQVAVAPSARRSGVGRALVAASLAEARARSKRLALLEVRASNEAALALYRAFGFDIVHTRKGYYRDPDEDALEMALELTTSAPPRPSR